MAAPLLHLLPPLTDEQAAAAILHYGSCRKAAAALYVSKSTLCAKAKRWREGQIASIPAYPPPLTAALRPRRSGHL